MNRSVVARILEAFFRTPFLYVAPLVAMIVYGIVAASNSSDEFTSDGAVFVDRGSLVTDLTAVADGGFGSYLTPAQFTSQELNGLLQTDVFLESVLREAGIPLGANPLSLSYQVADVRRAVTSFATSENLLQVRVTTSNPTISVRLASATIDRFIDFKVELDIAESTAANEFFVNLAAEYEDDVIAAQEALDAYLATLPEDLRSVAILGNTEGVTGIGGLTPSQQQQLNRLNATEVAARDRYDKALDDLEAARLAELQADTDVRQSIFVVDPPQLAQEPNSGLTDMVITIAMFTVVGIVVATIGPVIAALVSRGVLLPEDLAHLPGTGVIAVVPSVSKGDLKLAKAAVPRFSAAEVVPDLQPVTSLPSSSSEPDLPEGAPDFAEDERERRPRSRWARA